MMNTYRTALLFVSLLIAPMAVCQSQGGPPAPPGMFPGGGMMPQPGMGLPPGIHSPELARKVNKILALRHIVSLGLARRDIENALPILKRMSGAEQVLQEQAGQILDEEYRALLTADAASLPPAESGPRLGQLVARYSQQQQAQWQALERAIGPQKARGLRMLVEGPTPAFGPMGPAPGREGLPPGAPPLRPEGAARGPQGGPGFGPGGIPGNPGQPFDGPGGPLQGPPPGGGGPFPPRQMQMRPGEPFAGFPMFGAHISLADLVDLLQAKLAAMKG